MLEEEAIGAVARLTRDEEEADCDRVYSLPAVPLLFVHPGGRRDEAGSTGRAGR